MEINPQDEQYQRDMMRLKQLEQRKADILRLKELEDKKADLIGQKERSILGSVLGVPARGFAKGYGGLADLVAMPAKFISQQTGKILNKYPGLEGKFDEYYEEPNYSQFTELADKATNKLFNEDLSPQNTFEEVISGTTEFMTPGRYAKAAKGGLSELAKYGGKLLPAALGASTAIHALPKLPETPMPTTPEGEGIPGRLPGADFVEDLVKGVAGAYAGHSLGNFAKTGANALKGTKNKILDAMGLSQDLNEKAAKEALASVIGSPDEALKVSERLRNYESPIGYKPTIAEIAENPNLAQLQRSKEGVIGSGFGEAAAEQNKAIRGAFEELVPNQASIEDTAQEVAFGLNSQDRNIRNSTKTMDMTREAPEAGFSARESIASDVSDLKKIRSKETKPLYDKIKKSEERLFPKESYEYYKEEVKNAKGEYKDDLEKAVDLLRPNSISPKSYKKSLSQIESYGLLDSKNVKLEDVLPTPTVGELDKASKVIGNRIKSLKRSGDNDRAKILLGLKNKIEADLQSFPLAKETKELYKNLSEPISKIMDSPYLKSILKKDVFERTYKVLDSEVFPKLINSSPASISNARAFKERFGNNKNAMENARYYINNMVFKDIIDPVSGHVDVNKMNAFIKKYPSIREVYPELFDVNLKNASNAQIAYNDFYKKTQSVADTLERNALKEFIPGKNPKRIFSNIFNKDSYDNALGLVEKIGGNEQAMDGLRRYTADGFIESIQNMSSQGKGGRVISVDKYRKFMKEHKKAMETIYSPEQMKVITHLGEILEGRNYAATEGFAKGSPTSANLSNIDVFEATVKDVALNALKKSTKNSVISKNMVVELLSYFKNARKNKIEKMVNNALIDKDYAVFLLEKPFKDDRAARNFIATVKERRDNSFIGPRIAATRLTQDEEE